MGAEQLLGLLSMFIAQIIGIFAMLFSVVSFQQKTQRRIVFMQLIASSLWSIHFYLLGALTGCFLNMIAAMRDVVFCKRDQKWASGSIWIYIVVFLSIGIYVLNFTVFALDFTVGNAVLELLPAAGNGGIYGGDEDERSQVRIDVFLL